MKVVVIKINISAKIKENMVIILTNYGTEVYSDYVAINHVDVNYHCYETGTVEKMQEIETVLPVQVVPKPNVIISVHQNFAVFVKMNDAEVGLDDKVVASDVEKTVILLEI